jgi:hypothetical protein
MGSDVTPTGLKFQINDRIKPIGTLQMQALAAGADPKDVDVNASQSRARKGQKPEAWHISFFSLHDFLDLPLTRILILIFSIEISNMFGSDSTKGGIEFQFRQIKTNAKAQKNCFGSGGDPMTLGIGSIGGVAKGSSTFHCVASLSVSYIYRTAHSTVTWI